MNIASTAKTTQTPEKPGRPPRLGRILVAVDFSDSSKAALEHAVALAGKFSAALELVHVVEPCIYPEDLADGISVEEIDARWTQRKKEELESFRQANVKEGIPATAVITRGTAWTQVVEAAKLWNADLIVIGTRGLTGLKHMLLGSTAERVVRHAACPVLVVHAGQK